MTPQTGPSWLPAATFGVSAFSSLIGGIGRYEQGQAERRAYDYNADITIQNARAQAGATAEESSAYIGQQASRYAASGVDIASGSPLLIMAATAGKFARRETQIMQEGDEKAAMLKYYGAIAAFSGTMGGIGSFLSGLSQAAGGYYGATANLPPPTGTTQTGGTPPFVAPQ
jgi:hypothetical protein